MFRVFRVFRELHPGALRYSLSLRSHPFTCLSLGVLAKQVLITGDANIAARVCRLSGDCSTLHTVCEACSCELLHSLELSKPKAWLQLSGQLKMAFVLHRKRQGQRHAESMLTGKLRRASFLSNNIGLSSTYWPLTAPALDRSKRHW